MTEAERRAVTELIAALMLDQAPAVRPSWQALPGELVRRHLLGPLAYEAGAVQFRSDHVMSAVQADRRAELLQEVVDTLARQGIVPLLLKGVAYAGTIYPNVAARPMSDIDLLVRPSRFEAAFKALRRIGFWHVGGPHQRSPAHHALTLKRRDAAIDLHRHIVHAGRSRIDLDDLWRRARPSHVAGALRAAPGDEYLLHVAHLGRHELSVPLVNFVDAARLRVRADDVTGLAREWGLEHTIGAVDRAIALLLGDRGSRRPWDPELAELLGVLSPPRALQILRKIMYMNGMRGAFGLGIAVGRSRARW